MSRLNFLELLRAGHDDYVVNDDALAYMRRRNLSQAVLGLLANHQAMRFTDAGHWRAHLAALGIDQLKLHPNPVRIATEGALYGSVTAHQFLRDAVILEPRRRSVQRRPSCAVLGPRRAADPQAGRLQRRATPGHRTDQGADLVVLRRPQGLPAGTDAPAKAGLKARL